jgi:hypothetical protein
MLLYLLKTGLASIAAIRPGSVTQSGMVCMRTECMVHKRGLDKRYGWIRSGICRHVCHSHLYHIGYGQVLSMSPKLTQLLYRAFLPVA